MSRKKRDERRNANNKLNDIYAEEPPDALFFNERREDPVAFREGSEWRCGRVACMNDHALLFDLGDDGHVCGHCYFIYQL